VLPLLHPRAWRVASALLVASVVVACLVPSGTLEVPQRIGIDKVQHFVAYATLATWFGGLYPRSRYPLIAACLALLGLVIELLQQLMGLGREADSRDMMANLAGIFAGLALGVAVAGGWAPRLESWLARR
jgi:VanZ family protein